MCNDRRVHPPSPRAATDVDGGLEEPKRSANHVMARNDANETRRVPTSGGSYGQPPSYTHAEVDHGESFFRYTNGTIDEQIDSRTRGCYALRLMTRRDCKEKRSVVGSR